MERTELTTYGHLAGCNFKYDPNRVIGGMKTACVEFNRTGRQCRAHLSPQSCDLQLCARHWEWYCEKDAPGWCYHLSRCANIRADGLGLTQQERFRVIPSNISRVLELPSGEIHGHISATWRKTASESNTRGDFDLSDDDINSDNGSDDSDLDGFIADDDSEIEYRSDKSDSEDERPLKRARHRRREETIEEPEHEIIDLTIEVPKRPIRRIIVESDSDNSDNSHAEC